jgi:hypothetical protein
MTVTPTGPRPTHPDAKLALWLSVLLDGAPPNFITRILNDTRCNRRLFVLATKLMKGHK